MNFGSLKSYIGGALVKATHGGQKTILCPADEKPIADVAWADEADALKALEAAQDGFKYWSALRLSERTMDVQIADCNIGKGNNFTTGHHPRNGKNL